MGIFSGIKNNVRKSEAAVVVQNLLEIQQRKGFPVTDPGTLANLIVGGAWAEKPHLFDGSQRQRPHKITIAAVSLARYCEMPQSVADRDAVLSALAMALDELHNNASRYDLRDSDVKLIGLATHIFERLVPELGA